MDSVPQNGFDSVCVQPTIELFLFCFLEKLLLGGCQVTVRDLIAGFLGGGYQAWKMFLWPFEEPAQLLLRNVKSKRGANTFKFIIGGPYRFFIF